MSDDDGLQLPDMPTLSITSKATMRKCTNLLVGDHDIFICSYPKSGTTWTQHIVLSLLMLHQCLQEAPHHYADDGKDLAYEHVSDYAPFFEADKYWKDDSDELIDSIQQNHLNLNHRVFNTHLRGNMIPTRRDKKNMKYGAKCIYVIRSPLDVVISFYYHLSNQVEGNFDQSFDSFFNDWIHGELPYGSWMDHVLSYAPYLNQTPERKETDKGNSCLFLCYEDMVSDLYGSVQKIVAFLDLDTVIAPKHIERMIPSFTFDQMKLNIFKFQPRSVSWKNDFCFLRKGIVGDSKTTSLLSSKQKDQFQQLIQSTKFHSQLELLIDDESVVEKIRSII